MDGRARSAGRSGLLLPEMLIPTDHFPPRSATRAKLRFFFQWNRTRRLHLRMSIALRVEPVDSDLEKRARSLYSYRKGKGNIVRTAVLMPQLYLTSSKSKAFYRHPCELSFWFIRSVKMTDQAEGVLFNSEKSCIY